MSPVVASRLVQIRASPLMPAHAGPLGHHAILPSPYAGAPGPFPPSPFLTEPSQTSLTQSLANSTPSSVPVSLIPIQAQTAAGVPPVPFVPMAAGSASKAGQDNETKSSALTHRTSCASQMTSSSGPLSSSAIPPPRSGTCASRHMAAEQRRRARINERLEALREIVPHSARANTAAFLTEVYDYISTLHRELNRRSEADAEVHFQKSQEESPKTSKAQPGLPQDSCPTAASNGPPSTPTPQNGAGGGLDLSLGMGSGSGDAPPSPCKSEGADESSKIVDGVILAGQAAPGRMQARGAFSAYVSSGKQGDRGASSPVAVSPRSKVKGGSDRPVAARGAGECKADVQHFLGRSDSDKDVSNHSKDSKSPSPSSSEGAPGVPPGAYSSMDSFLHSPYFSVPQLLPSSSPSDSDRASKHEGGYNLVSSPSAGAAGMAGGSGVVPSQQHPVPVFPPALPAVGHPPGAMVSASTGLPSTGSRAGASGNSRKRKEVPSTSGHQHHQESQGLSNGAMSMIPGSQLTAASAASASMGSAGASGNYHMMMPMLPPMHPMAMAAAAAAAADAAAAAAVQQWNMAAAVAQAQAQAAVQAHAQAQALASAVAASSAAAASAVAGASSVPPASHPSPGLRSTSPPLPQLLPGQLGTGGRPQSVPPQHATPAAHLSQSGGSAPAPPKRRRKNDAKEASSCSQSQKVVRPIAVRPRP